MLTQADSRKNPPCDAPAGAGTGVGTRPGPPPEFVGAETERGRHHPQDQKDLDSDNDHDEHPLPEGRPARVGHLPDRSIEWVVHGGPQRQMSRPHEKSLQRGVMPEGYVRRARFSPEQPLVFGSRSQGSARVIRPMGDHPLGRAKFEGRHRGRRRCFREGPVQRWCGCARIQQVMTSSTAPAPAPAPAPPPVEADQLTKRFGQLTAVDGIDLALPAGRIYGLLGPNGSGKTTLIRLLTGLARPTSGIGPRPRASRCRRAPNLARIGYMTQADGDLPGAVGLGEPALLRRAVRRRRPRGA